MYHHRKQELCCIWYWSWFGHNNSFLWRWPHQQIPIRAQNIKVYYFLFRARSVWEPYQRWTNDFLQMSISRPWLLPICYGINTMSFSSQLVERLFPISELFLRWENIFCSTLKLKTYNFEKIKTFIKSPLLLLSCFSWLIPCAHTW